MTKQEFKEKWLDNAFYWINEYNYTLIQNIMLEFGFKCHTGDSFIIPWHSKFNTLVTFPTDGFHDFEYFQKVDCWLPDAVYGEPKDYNKMLVDYGLYRLSKKD